MIPSSSNLGRATSSRPSSRAARPPSSASHLPSSGTSTRPSSATNIHANGHLFARQSPLLAAPTTAAPTVEARAHRLPSPTADPEPESESEDDVSLPPRGFYDLDPDPDADFDSSPSSSEYEPVTPSPPAPLPPDWIELAVQAQARALGALQRRQYWRPEWRPEGVPRVRGFDIGDPSTLGPTLHRVLDKGHLGHVIIHAEQERYISEQDAVREVLMALQGRENVLLTCSNNVFELQKPGRRLVHLSIASQASMLLSFAQTATTVHQLRTFTAAVFAGAIPSTRTIEAFADAVDHEVRAFDAWCAAREEAVAAPGRVVSLLSTEKAVSDAFEGSFAALDAVVRAISPAPGPGPAPARRRAAETTAHLLDELFGAARAMREQGQRAAAAMLLRVFVRSAEPVWGMVGRWLRDGMRLEPGGGAGGGWGRGTRALEDEFFVDGGAGVGAPADLLDPEFWREGYTLRAGAAVPVFLEHVAGPVLEAGKAVGLLRALGMDGGGGELRWRSFGALMATATPGREEGAEGAYLASVDALSQLVYDELAPPCAAMCARLAEVLVGACGLPRHLRAIEDLFLMRRGDEMSHFVDVLFAKMDTAPTWADFHFLNTAFADVVGAGTWVSAPLVRLAHRGGYERERGARRTVRALEGLGMEYAVPFPLTYVCAPRVMGVYGDVFVFLLQMRRAKGVLEGILVRGRGSGVRADEMKAVYAMRSRLAWFVNTLFNFMTTYVIHTQVVKFHAAFSAAKSLDEMIRVHDEHVEKIQARCLLKTNTSALHRAILSILDMCMRFSESFIAFAGDSSTHDISRLSMASSRRHRHHRSRRQRRQRRNVIGFASSLAASHDSADSSTDEEAEEAEAAALEHSLVSGAESFSAGASWADEGDEGLFGRTEKMGAELDGLVRFVRRGVESLAGGVGEAAAAFGVLAFALEDWEL